MGIERVLAALEAWVHTDPSWGRFQEGCGKGWDIRFRVMDPDEAIDWRNKIIWLAVWRWPDPMFRTCHAVGHLKMHYHAEVFTEEMCQEADEFAVYWLAMTAEGSVRPIVAA